MNERREAAKARVRAKIAAEKALPASERIANVLNATHTHAEAQALLDEVRAEARAEVLREAAEVAVRAARSCGDTEAGQYAASVAAGVGKELRRMADAAGKGTPTEQSARIPSREFTVFPKIVRQAKVKGAEKDLTVSTVQIGFRRYSTVIFDDHPDRRHTGKRVGKHVIDADEVRSDTREEAMEAHREALYVARTEPIR